MVSHGSLAGYTEHAAAYLRGDGGVPLFLSVAFDISVPALYPPLVTGRQVTMLPDDLDLAALGRALADTAPHAFIDLTPSHLELLCHQLGPADAARLTGLFVAGGQALPYAHVRSWWELDTSTPIVNEYGPTEATVGCLRHPVDDPRIRPTASSRWGRRSPGSSSTSWTRNCSRSLRGSRANCASPGRTSPAATWAARD
nr:hypothetical protein GCM10020093_033960 [Planobispora longispora]